MWIVTLAGQRLYKMTYQMYGPANDANDTASKFQILFLVLLNK